ncbi:MAG: hypothetical protein AAF614_30385 [Chloroflexota bacterium]
MRHILRLTLLILFMMLLLGCASSTPAEAEPSPIAQAAPSETPEPTVTPTATPEPTATATATYTPTPEPTATPTPSPTPLACDTLILETAIDSMSALDTYRNVVEAQMAPQGEAKVIIFRMDMLAVLENGRIQALDATMETRAAEQGSIHVIFAENGIYFQDPEGGWQLMEGELGETVLQQMTESQYLKPELVESLDEADCTVSVEEMDGQLVQVYQYSQVDINDISSISGQTLADTSSEVEAVAVDISLQSVNGRLLPIKFQMNLSSVVEGEMVDMAIIQSLQDINVPVEIAIPENVATPTFMLDVSLPDDAEVSIESEEVLVFSTAESKEAMLVFYRNYFAANGWTQTDTYEAEQQDILLTITEFSRGNLEAAFAVGETNGVTVISLVAGETP